MLSKRHIVVGLGELLWDLFSAGKQLGGAPANFAYITSLLGDHGIPASRVGRDALGVEAVRRLGELVLPTEFVQEDTEHPTGTVKIEVDGTGQPRFEISESVAWDFLDWTPQWQALAQRADAVCFGSLGQRSERSRSTIRSFVLASQPCALRVFDVNLRQNFYTVQVLAESMKLATIVKLNHEELPRIMRLFELENRGEEDSARRLLSSYGLKLVCITRGNSGSLLLSADDRSEHPGFKVKVADTVGAGDAFTAALVHGYLRGTSLAQINEVANRVGAWVASESGATPSLKPGGLAQTLAEIS
ncbi:MAG: carbohydrate kinase [Candidatus Sulfotelmatobacter sp.]|jgi:fructokinase